MVTGGRPPVPVAPACANIRRHRSTIVSQREPMTAQRDRTRRNHRAHFGFLAIFGAGIAGLMSMSAAQAQMPPDLAQKVAAMGRVVDPENTGKLYAPFQEKEPYAGVKVTRDVKYGSDPRNVVDIFVPETGAAGRPVLMFVHGGGMIRGTK